ncbi:MAG: TIGR00269 family protein [Desulfurococcales archaeon]|nr:TIGR00269 family protein [Desulfurococcales archaeon]
MARTCSVCGVRRAIVYQPHTGRSLCRECFLEDVKDRVKREIERWRMIQPGDRILLGLSGGKDSYVMLDILAEMHDPSRLVGVSIIEGIPGYNREEDIEKIKSHARRLGVDVVITSIREYTGHSLYEIVARSRSRGSRQSPCTFCGISRRRILNMYARMYGVDKTATAHNLDDEAQTAVVNMLRGDIVGLLRQHPLSPPVSSDIIPRIKPLRKIYEWETAVYSVQKGYPLQETECMFINRFPTLRARVREELYRLEAERPGTLLRILENLDTLLEEPARRLEREELPKCEKCGEPTSYGRRICKLCEILEEAGVEKPAYTLRRPTLLTRTSRPRF